MLKSLDTSWQQLSPPKVYFANPIFENVGILAIPLLAWAVLHQGPSTDPVMAYTSNICWSSQENLRIALE